MASKAKSKPFVLITNGWLQGRSGTEIVTRDFALGLAARGWRVAVYSPMLGPPASTELEGRAEMISDFAALDRAPDIIHGQHYPTIVPALVRFAETPVFQLCHSLGWFDRPLMLERVRLHAAVDDLCRERVAHDAGLPLDAVALLRNAINLSFCPPRPPLPVRPRRVLVVAHHANGHLEPCIAACGQAGLEIGFAGAGAGRAVFDLPGEMAKADIVIGAARVALEAMAVGCAVVVCDSRGLAGMATSADFDAWRAANFGHSLLTEPVTAEAVASALAAYAPADAGDLSRRVRETCGLDLALDQLEGFYRQVIELHRARPADKAREAAALAAQLQQFLAMDVFHSPWAKELESVVTELDEKTVQLDGLTAEVKIKTARLDGLIAELARRGVHVQFETKAQEDPASGEKPG